MKRLALLVLLSLPSIHPATAEVQQQAAITLPTMPSNMTCAGKLYNHSLTFTFSEEQNGFPTGQRSQQIDRGIYGSLITGPHNFIARYGEHGLEIHTKGNNQYRLLRYDPVSKILTIYWSHHPIATGGRSDQSWDSDIHLQCR